jgi:hypothetical protein
MLTCARGMVTTVSASGCDACRGRASSVLLNKGHHRLNYLKVWRTPHKATVPLIAAAHLKDTSHAYSTYLFPLLPLGAQFIREKLVSLHFLKIRQPHFKGISPWEIRYLHTKNRLNSDKHTCLEWDSNPKSQCSSRRRHFLP